MGIINFSIKEERIKDVGKIFRKLLILRGKKIERMMILESVENFAISRIP